MKTVTEILTEIDSSISYSEINAISEYIRLRSDRYGVREIGVMRAAIGNRKIELGI